MDRRTFVHGVGATLAGTVLTGLPVLGNNNNQQMTVQQVIDLIIKNIPGAPFANTVDTIKAGDAGRVVKGIITTMFATIDVIRQAAASGANFIIAHEPTFYNHLDDTSWLKNDAVYQYKMALLDKHGITVWRCHDYLHAYEPDGVMTGVLAKLGWQEHADKNKPYLLSLPTTSLGAIIDHVKNKLAIPHLRFAGKKANPCRRIALLPGASGGKTQISVFSADKPDLLIVGELAEWETLEYTRDLQASGSIASLIILGHIPSEEPGLEWLANWLRPQLKNIPISHIDPGSALSWD
jgi:putative NIF3 family GTP cyclohydrolase 1 type 2